MPPTVKFSARPLKRMPPPKIRSPPTCSLFAKRVKRRQPVMFKSPPNVQFYLLAFAVGVAADTRSSIISMLEFRAVILLFRLLNALV